MPLELIRGPTGHEKDFGLYRWPRRLSSTVGPILSLKKCLDFWELFC